MSEDRELIYYDQMPDREELEEEANGWLVPDRDLALTALHWMNKYEILEKHLLRIADIPSIGPIIETATGKDVTVEAMRQEAQQGLAKAFRLVP